MGRPLIIWWGRRKYQTWFFFFAEAFPFMRTQHGSLCLVRRKSIFWNLDHFDFLTDWLFIWSWMLHQGPELGAISPCKCLDKSENQLHHISERSHFFLNFALIRYMCMPILFRCSIYWEMVSAWVTEMYEEMTVSSTVLWFKWISDKDPTQSSWNKGFTGSYMGNMS